MKVLKLRTMYHTNRLVVVSATFQSLVSDELIPKLFIFHKYSDDYMAVIHRDSEGIEVANLNGGWSWLTDLRCNDIIHHYEKYPEKQMKPFKIIRDYAVKRKNLSKLIPVLNL